MVLGEIINNYKKKCCKISFCVLNSFSLKKEWRMPNIKSAKKRVLVINRRREENRYVKSTMATMIKKFRVAVNSDVNKAEKMLNEIISYIDSAKSKGVIHKNNASRKVSRLNLMLNKAKLNSSTKQAEKVEEVAEPKQEVKEEKKATRTKKEAEAKTETKKKASKKSE